MPTCDTRAAGRLGSPCARGPHRTPERGAARARRASTTESPRPSGRNTSILRACCNEWRCPVRAASHRSSPRIRSGLNRERVERSLAGRAARRTARDPAGTRGAWRASGESATFRRVSLCAIEDVLTYIKVARRLIPVFACEGQGVSHDDREWTDRHHAIGSMSLSGTGNGCRVPQRRAR